MTSLLIGRLAPVDAGDGYGTNLVDIRCGAWSQAAMEAAAPGLNPRLPRLLLQDAVVGRVSAYLVKRFGFNPNAEVVVGSGDNPCSLVGLGLIGKSYTHAISLGTSDTYFGYAAKVPQAERTEGHIFGAADGGTLFLVCFKNGSLAREKVKDDYGMNWEDFSRVLLETEPGNHGRVMLPYFMPEITPLILQTGAQRFGGLAANDSAGNVRAVAEAQAIGLYLHSAWVGERPARIYVTAGGSENRGLLTEFRSVLIQALRSISASFLGAIEGFIGQMDKVG